MLRRNLSITLIATTISVVLCTLGFNPETQPLDSIAVIWPGAILQAFAGALFGGWGVVATVLAGLVADILLAGTVHASIGYILPDLLQALIPAWYYRHRIAQYGWTAPTFHFWPFFIFSILISNIVGAVTATCIFQFYLSHEFHFWFPLMRWLVANIPIALLLGWPLFRYLGPTLAQEGLVMRGWWQ